MCFRIPCGLETFFIVVKEFKTIDEQIIILKNKGLIFKDEHKAKKLLIANNYYNIINGYKDLFIIKKNNEMFLNNTTFEEIYSLYEFDRKIKDILLEYILKVENSLRSYIAYYFSMQHGNDNYLKLDSFDNFNGIYSVSQDTKKNRIHNIQDLIGTIHKEIAKSLNTKEYINHYLINYGFIPMWVLVNILSFGVLSKFLELMKQGERIHISQHFNIMENELIQYTKLLAYFRNLCAHDDRIYNVKVPKYLYIPNNKYHSLLNLSKLNGMYKYGKNDLFALIISLKIMLPSNEFNTLYNKINGRIISLSNNLNVISINDVLKIMKFPSNWQDIKKF